MVFSGDRIDALFSKFEHLAPSVIEFGPKGLTEIGVGCLLPLQKLNTGSTLLPVEKQKPSRLVLAISIAVIREKKVAQAQ